MLRTPVTGRWLGVPLCIFLTVAGCSSQPGDQSGNEPLLATPQATAPASPTPTPSPINDPLLKEKAIAFDRFLKDDLNPTEVFLLKESCQKKPDESIFCFSILNRERLNENLKERAKRPRIPKGRTLHPRFAKGEVTNWDALRAGGINGLIRGLSSVRPTEIRELEKKAIAETACPNNIAIALAANLEDELPEQTDPAEIAALYERGGLCIENIMPDREVLLSRAGIFYMLGKKYDLAVKALTQSAALEQHYNGRSLYWLYRAYSALDNKEKAKATLTTLQTRYPFSFHTIIALNASGKDPGEILAKSFIPTLKRSAKEPAVNSLIDQFEALRSFGLIESATKVLNWGISESIEAEPELRMHLAELKRDNSDFRTRIQLLTDILYKNPTLISRETMELYFPKAFFPYFEKNAAGVDPFLLMSVARQESAFNPRAVSHANARGLLQVHPKTARRFHKSPNLMDPESNIDIGSKYILELLARVSDKLHLALAAYNAGEKRLDTWTQRYVTEEPILFIDLIPYRETREYIASVLRNYYWYRRMNTTNVQTAAKGIFDLQLGKATP